MKKLALSDFNPLPTKISLQDANGKEIRAIALRRFDLLAQIWVGEEFGSYEEFESLLRSTKPGEVWKAILKTAHHLLEDSSPFPSWEELGKCFATPKELLALQEAILRSMGNSMPLEESGESAEKKS